MQALTQPATYRMRRPKILLFVRFGLHPDERGVTLDKHLVNEKQMQQMRFYFFVLLKLAKSVFNEIYFRVYTPMHRRGN